MTTGNLQDYVFNARYAHWNAAQGRRETWDETVDRVFAMHRRRYAACDLADPIAFAETAMREQLVLGSQRALQFGGKPIEDKHARLYNCTGSYCDRPRFFQEAFWLLLCGCGVGFSVQRHHVARLPAIARPAGPRLLVAVEDSIEGWADALGALLSGYFVDDQPHAEAIGRVVDFDFSAVRPKGATLASGSGTAPGPGPLRRSLECIRTVLETRLIGGAAGVQLRPIDCYDIVMHAADAVLSGGVRRSATISLFSPDDDEMATAKTGDWFTRNPQRGRSNNSALLLRDGTDRERFRSLMEHVREFGEPGFVWADSTEIIYNPCVEIGLHPVDSETGLSGWGFCNLTEINLKACADAEDFARAARASAILGTLQAGYSDLPYLGEVTQRIVRREALLGCSMTGMMDNPAVAFDAALQRRMARLILEVNADIAARIGIAPAARATCVKPAGSSSCVLGTASGIHPHHARRYFRRVQANASEPALARFREVNPAAVERSVWNPNGTDQVITFCVEAPAGGLTREAMDATRLLDYVKLTQENWVAAGRRPERCANEWVRHNVSNTISVRPDEWEAVTAFIFEHRHAFAGVSLLPFGGDLDYPQAPFCAVWSAEDIAAEYGPGAIMASGLIVDGLHAFADDLWAACACALGIGERLEPPIPPDDSADALARYQDQVKTWLAKKDWVRRAVKFAGNYFGGNLREMTHCLKRVHNCKRWEDLTRVYRRVDYSAVAGDIRVEETAACAGGGCEII